MARIGGQVIPRNTLLLVASEGFIVFISLAIAAAVSLAQTGTVWQYLFDSGTLWRFGVVVVICELSFYYNDLYDLQAVRSTLLFSIQLLQALGVALIFLGVSYYINEQLSPGRGIAVLAAPTILVLLMAWRYYVGTVVSRVQPKERVLIAGTGAVGQQLAHELENRPEFNYEVVGCLLENHRGVGELNIPVVGNIQEIEQVAAEQKVDRIVLSLAEKRGGMPVRELLHLKFKGITIEDPHSFYERISGRVVLDGILPSWFILSEGFRQPRFTLFLKRISDILIALLGLVLALPIIALVAIAIIIEDGAPVLFRQKRIGLDGRPFEILKFRSMRTAPPDAKPSWTGDGDPRVTRVGKLIRTFRFDELPQFINVLRGDMSLVGPRPEVPYFTQMLEEKIPFFGQRHAVRPGITGWAQIKYHYGASVEDARRKLELDLFYIKHLSFVLDLAIIFETAKVVVFGRGAK